MIKGSKHTEESKRKNREANTGKKHTEETKRKISKANTGKKVLEESKRKMSEAKKDKYKGPDHPNWKGGITPLCDAIRKLPQYINWRTKVFERDKYTCQQCKRIGGSLQAHHIISFSDIISNKNINTIDKALDCDFLWSINDGVTVCNKCHSDIKTYWNNKYEYIRKEPNITITMPIYKKVVC